MEMPCPYTAPHLTRTVVRLERVVDHSWLAVDHSPPSHLARTVVRLEHVVEADTSPPAPSRQERGTQQRSPDADRCFRRGDGLRGVFPFS